MLQHNCRDQRYKSEFGAKVDGKKVCSLTYTLSTMDSGYGYQALLNQSDVDASRVTFTGLDSDSLLCTSGSGTLTTAVVGSGLTFVGGILVSTANAAWVRALLSAGTGIGYDSSTGVITNTGVTSLAGTSNQIAASAATGAVTLSLPQDIGLTSNVSFANIAGTLTTSSQPNIVTLASVTDLNGIPIGANTLGNSSTSLVCGSLQLATSPSAGYVLTSDASGVASWAAAAGGGVSSITGTANQIIASAGTGAVTLSTPQDIATTSSPTFAAITATGSANAQLIQGTFQNTNSGTGAFNEIRVLNDASLGLRLGITSSTYTGWLGDAYIYNGNNAGINFGTNAAGGRMYINAAGNVGIGTTSPTYQLTLGNSRPAVYLVHNVAGTTVMGMQHNGGNAFLLRNNAYRDPTTGVDAQVDAGKDSWDMYTEATSASSNFTVRRAPAGSISWTNLMTLLANGNLGIGTAAPDYKLHANGYLGVWDSGLLPGYNNTGNKFSSKIIMGNAYSPVIRAFYPNNTYTDSIDLQFLTSGPNIPTENVDPKMVIKAMTGNVGIGTTVPTHKLDVLGDIKTYSSANDVMLLVSPDSGNYMRIDAWNIANSVQKNIVLNQTGGNVGIGITGPTTTLQLWNGSKGGQISLGQQGDPTPYMNMGMDTGWQQYICNNAQWTGSAFNYVNTGGYGGKASRIAQESGNIYFDVAYGGSNPISWDRRLNIQNSGAVICGGTFSAPTVNATSNLQKNGTNIVTMIMTTGSWALTGATARYSANHNSGALPTFIEFNYVCTTANFNWQVGDRLPVSCDAQVSDHVGNPWFDGSLIGFYFSDPPRLIAMDKYTNTVRQLTTASWSMEWRAFRSI